MSASHVKVGDVLGGKYRVERVLGAGGMGMVVAARHIELGQRVALKLMLKEAMADPANAERFAREARSAVRLQSLHTARVLDVGKLNNGEPYIVMEYLDGQDLDEVVRRNGPMPPHAAVDYILQACEAFAEAHGLGMIHRDIKPKNLFLAKTVDGRRLVKVLDFGLAKTIGALGDVSLTATSSVFGSPQYMSPEQMRSAKDVDARSDIWSIGVCLYELLTARVPFDAAGLAEICAMVLKDPVEPPSKWAYGLPPDLDAVVVKCLAKDPADRYQTVADLAVALEPWSATEGSANRILHVMQTVQRSDFPTMLNADFQAHGAAGPQAEDGPKTMNAWDSGERARPPARRISPVMMALGGFGALAAIGVALAGIASFASHRSRTTPSSVSTSQATLAPTGVAVAVTAEGTASDAPAGKGGALVPGLIAASPMPPVNATPNRTETAAAVEPASAQPAAATSPLVRTAPTPHSTTTLKPAPASARPAASAKSSKPLGPMDRL